MDNYYFKQICVSVSLVLMSVYFAQAQSTVFNQPSAGVQGEKSSYLELDFITHPVKDENGGFRSYGLRYVYGTSKRTEVGINAFYTKASGEVQPVEIQPNAKWQIYNNEEKGISVGAGGMLYIPVTRREGTDTNGMVYFSVSKKIKGDYAPRFTGGSYAFIGANNGSGTKTGVFVGYEQPLKGRFGFLADWASGNNRIGYAAAGLSVTLTKKSVLYVGYSVGNQGRGNNSIGIYYGHSF